MKKNKELILGYVVDLVQDFVYYDRKEDEDLGRGDIEKALDSGEICLLDIVDQFRNSLGSWDDNREKRK